MSDERAGEGPILDALVAELRLAEGWQHAMAEAFNRHYAIGRLMLGFESLDEYLEVVGDELGPEDRSLMTAAATAHASDRGFEIGREWRRLKGFALGTVPTRPATSDIVPALRARPGSSVAHGLERCLVGVAPEQLEAFLDLVVGTAEPSGKLGLEVYPPAAVGARWARIRVCGDKGEPHTSPDDPLLTGANAVLVRQFLHEGIAAEVWLPCR